MNNRQRIIYVILTLLMYLGYVLMIFDVFKLGIHILCISGILFLFLFIKIMKYGQNKNF